MVSEFTLFGCLQNSISVKINYSPISGIAGIHPALDPEFRVMPLVSPDQASCRYCMVTIRSGIRTPVAAKLPWFGNWIDLDISIE